MISPRGSVYRRSRPVTIYRGNAYLDEHKEWFHVSAHGLPFITISQSYPNHYFVPDHEPISKATQSLFSKHLHLLKHSP